MSARRIAPLLVGLCVLLAACSDGQQDADPEDAPAETQATIIEQGVLSFSEDQRQAYMDAAQEAIGPGTLTEDQLHMAGVVICTDIGDGFSEDEIEASLVAQFDLTDDAAAAVRAAASDGLCPT